MISNRYIWSGHNADRSDGGDYGVMYNIAVIGDIHSNHIGLEACIEHALLQGVEEFLFIGDYISDYPYPQKTMEIIYRMKKEYPCTFIRGNREDYMLSHRNELAAGKKENWVYNSCSGNLLYTYENLTEKDLDFFEGMDIKGIYQKEGYPPFWYCHGSMTRSNELLLPENPDMEKIMRDMEVNLLVSGHTHIQKKRIYGDKKLLHPGAVGVAWYHEGDAQYMILHGCKEGWEEEFFRLGFDKEKAEKEFEESGLLRKAPYWAKNAIYTMKTGNDYSVPCMEMAQKLCLEETGSADWPHIPEKYWEMAARHFGVEKE